MSDWWVGWVNDHEIHVMPTAELAAHSTQGCSCGTEFELPADGVLMVSHSAFEGEAS